MARGGKKKKSGGGGGGGDKSGGGGGGGGDRDFLKREDVLQAVLLADSFATTLRPVTFEKPKVLLPLVNVPMLNYTLEFLVQGGVKQVFVVCCAHAQQVAQYLRDSQWTSRASEVEVKVIVLGDNVFSTGDALRHLDELQVIQNDFVLISGDVISNIRLDKVVAAHKARVRKDKLNIMTMIVKKAAPTHRTRSMEDDVVMAVAEPSNQLLVYEDSLCQRELDLPTQVFEDHLSVALRYDLMDCHIDICTPEVLALFTDNFDYQDLRNDFLRGVLGSEILGHRVHVHSIRGEYAARVKDFRTYDSVSRDIIHRWTYPMVPDNNMMGDTSYRLSRGNIYREDAPGSDRRVFVARSATIGRETVIGASVQVGDGATVQRSVLGRGCRVGRNAVVRDSYLFDGCVVEDGAVVERSMLCSGAAVRAGTRVGPGAVLSFGVVVGPGAALPSHAKVTTFETGGAGSDSEFGSDPEDEQGAAEGADEAQPRDRRHSETSHGSLRDGLGVLGEGGVGRLYVGHEGDGSDDEDDEEEYEGETRAGLSRRFHFNSLAPDAAGFQAVSDKWNAAERARALAEFEHGDDDDDNSDAGWDQAEVARRRFLGELQDTISRGHHERLPVDAIQLEAASLKLSYDASVVEYSKGVAQTLCSFVVPAPAPQGQAPAAISREQLASLRRVIKTWGTLLGKFATDAEETRKMVFGIEAMCLENPLTYGPMLGYLLQFLYQDDVFSEEGIFAWEAERERKRGDEGISETEENLLKTCAKFLEWLREADEESSEEESSDDDDDDDDESSDEDSD